MQDIWEEFPGRPGRKKAGQIYVSLNYKGQMLLNKPAHEALGSPSAVTLYFSRTTSRIGLVPARPSTPIAFPVTERAFAHSKMIFASPFCRHYGIKVSGTIAFNKIDVDNNGMMTLDLASATRVSRSL